MPASAILTLNPPPAAPESTPAFTAILRPRDLSVNLRCVPYSLDEVRGVVTVTPRKIVLADIVVRDDAATLTASGTGELGPRPTWDLR